MWRIPKVKMEAARGNLLLRSSCELLHLFRSNKVKSAQMRGKKCDSLCTAPNATNTFFQRVTMFTYDNCSVLQARWFHWNIPFWWFLQKKVKNCHFYRSTHFCTFIDFSSAGIASSIYNYTGPRKFQNNPIPSLLPITIPSN